jgi:hypothetical protein
MKKIKPLHKKHRFIRWLKKLFGIKQPSKLLRDLGNIDEMHLVKPRLIEPIKIMTEVSDKQLDRIPLTKAEIQCRVHRALAEKLTREIIEKELYFVQVCEDPINFETHYRATLIIYPPEKEDENNGN